MVRCTVCERQVHRNCVGNDEIFNENWQCPNCRYRLAYISIDNASTTTNDVAKRTSAINSNTTQNAMVNNVQPPVSSTSQIRSVIDMERLIDQNIEDLRRSLHQPNQERLQVDRVELNLTPERPLNAQHNESYTSRPNRAELQKMLQLNAKEQENLRKERELIAQERMLLENIIDDQIDPPYQFNEVGAEAQIFENQPQVLQQLAHTGVTYHVGTEPLVPSQRQANQRRQFHSTPYRAQSAATETDGRLLSHSVPRRVTLMSPPRQRNSTTPVNYETFCNNSGPTMAQISARQTVGKELPIFSGDPTEWSTFIGFYEESNEVCNFSDSENFLRLKKCLKGPAQRIVSSLFTKSENVPLIIERLRRFFGKPELILDELIKRVRKLPPLKPEQNNQFIQFAIEVESLGATLDNPALADHRRNPALLRELLMKLPSTLQMSWADHVKYGTVNDIVEFSAWLYDKAAGLHDVMPSAPAQSRDKFQNKQVNHHDAHDICYSSDDDSVDQPENVFGGDLMLFDTVNYHDTNSSRKSCPYCNNSCNTVAACKKFREATLSDRWELVKRLDMCRKCLSLHSFNHPCPKPVKCTFIGCDKKHHPLLHNDRQKPYTTPKPPMADVGTTTTDANFNHQDRHSKTLFRYLPVRIQNGDKFMNVFAFLDEGSSTTLINQKIAEKLQLNGVNRPLCLTWTDENLCRTESDSQQVSFKISPIDLKPNSFTATARTISSLSLPNQSFDYDALKDKYPHLRQSPVNSYADAVPDLLIGLDNWRLAVPLKVNEGEENEPIAIKCRLGWSVVNATNALTSSTVNVHSCCSHKVTTNEELSELVKSFYTTDFLGIRRHTENILSKEEKQAMEILEKTTKRVGNRFQVGLLWKYKNFQLPESKTMARRRLKCLEASLRNKPGLKEIIDKQIQEHQAKDYVRKLSPEEASITTDKTSYIPMFPVLNPNKPGKIRLVWDFAAKSHGVSLNDMLLPGPDLNANLLHVLLRFRQGRFAVVGDIKEMFHRVKIAPEDQDAQRFLWGNDEYIFTAMAFGARCSPTSAQHVKNTNAREHANEYPQACKSIIDNTYVDDWLQSFTDEKSAVKVSKQVKEVHTRGGFEMRNWKSNSAIVLDNLGAEAAVTDGISLDLDHETEKVLGLFWNWRKDTFTYSLRFLKGGHDILSGERVPTKREVLRLQMSIFDPLGLISHFIVKLKILMQDLWRSKIDWDDCIDESHYNDFKAWLQVLPQIEKLNISRCYLNDLGSYDNAEIELHLFSDAGDKAVATAAYLRINKNQKITCSLVAAKSHVAPLKPTSMPRLELEAAVMASRLAKSLKKALELNISKTVYWSDSTTVVAWIQSDDVRPLGTFVALRVAEIQENTNPSEWRYVNTADNPADDATKWVKPPNMKATDRWFTGSKFLYQSEEHWPTKEVKAVSPNPHEPKPNLESHIAVHAIREPLIDFNRFSSWLKLRKTIAIMYSCPHRATRSPNILLVDDYDKADRWIFQQIQMESYPTEMRALRAQKDSGKWVALETPLRQLSPYIDEFGVMRVMGKIDAATRVPASMKRPIILPREHHVTRLILQHHHERMAHILHEATINEVRETFYVSKLRIALNQIRRNCPVCIRNDAKPVEPMQGQLPAARITPFTAPFTFTGMDFAGPFYVTVKRSTEKRYAVLFTCLVTRAIHVEIAYSMNTDACVCAVRTFMLLRGQPDTMFSDQGTNIKATEKILREEVSNVNFNKIAEEAAANNIKWKFNPPLSAHMGGSWERMVKCLKAALYASVPSRNFTDWSLKLAMAEATYMVNMRPLTYVSLNDENSRYLCPNDFLIGSINGVKPVGKLPDNDSLLKHNYLSIQQFRERLWRRWVKEYLPDLVRRTKNFELTQPLEIGDVVVICDSDLPANSWPQGKIIKTYPGNDNQVRSADVQTATGIYHRPTVKLAKLDFEKKE